MPKPFQIYDVIDAQNLEENLEITKHNLTSLWCAGRWNILASINEEQLNDDDDKGYNLGLIATALQNIEKHSEAKQMLLRAKQLNLDPEFIYALLYANVQNRLGRIASLNQNSEEAQNCYEKAISPIVRLVLPDEHHILAARVREKNELSTLGLMLQGVDIVEEELKNIDITFDPRIKVKLDVMQSEIGILRHELKIAQKRNQILVAKDTVASPYSNLKEKAVSQLGQELWALEKTNYKREGFFVEFGATDGILLSNTYMLEKEFGWNGILAEPNPVFFKELQSNRECIVTKACISGTSGDEVEFIFADVFGGMSKHMDADHHLEKRKAYQQDNRNVTTLKTISLNDFLKEHNAPKDIDYISVDTEGSELDILQAFPFKDWNVKLWTVEHNFTPAREEIFKIMTAHGYRRKESQWDDWYYLDTM